MAILSATLSNLGLLFWWELIALDSEGSLRRGYTHNIVGKVPESRSYRRSQGFPWIRTSGAAQLPRPVMFSIPYQQR